MNDYAGQRELIAENMMMSICIDLTKYLQELKQERKTVSWPRELTSPDEQKLVRGLICKDGVAVDVRLRSLCP